VSALSAPQLRSVVNQIRQILWFEFGTDKWNRDKEWKINTIECVSGVLDDYGLQPTKSEDGNAA